MRPILLFLVPALFSFQAMGSPMNESGGTTAHSVKQEHLAPLFTATLQYRSESQPDDLFSAEGHDGVLIGSGDGTAMGPVQGTVKWALWSGNCVYPAIRKGQSIPDGLHLCTMSPSGLVQTPDGAQIRFDGRGYGLRTPEKYRTSLTLVFATEDARYAWLTHVLGVMEGEFDEKTGRADWSVYVPSGSHR
jgi:hypothetical protein